MDRASVIMPTTRRCSCTSWKQPNRAAICFSISGSDLKAVVDQGLAWNATERFKAIRLLRLDARDPMYAAGIMLILHACQVLDPDAGNLVDAYWNELVAANPGWSIEQLRAWVPEMRLPEDKAAAQQELADIIKAETDRLEFKLNEFEERAEIVAKYWAHEQAFDLSPEAERMRRYETTCQRYVHQFFDRSVQAQGQ